ncbi:CPBP family intramembrane glutamic endopeptidase [Butyrivibrio sp. LB2008]|uniref:CPBP family intramembrane glutamic endopeptidase n=1 Tax=Butyrivibrio sp. LB2008 TaxID=1408305 RepID=UPI00047AB1D7|nr:CPBP family intramembrane glutamic endopeptidase [Butyrivibrio sp. LB2008]
MGMDYKKANLAFLFMILSTLALVICCSYWALMTGKELPLPVNNMLCEFMVLIPAVAMTLYSGDSLSSVIPLKKIKISSALLSVLYVVTLFPLVTFVNSISMLFVDNAVASISDQLVELPMEVMLLSIGLFGPFVEEIVFRGVLFQSYKRSGRIIASMVLSAVLFGMMHLNFNQFAYGAVMGVMFCLIVEATGSVLSSFIAHAVFNSFEVITMYNIDLGGAEDIATETSDLVLYIGVYFVLSVIFTAIALCIVYKMADIEGRKNYIDKLFAREEKELSAMFDMEDAEKKQTLITIPLIIVMIISVSFMIYSAIALRGM